MRVKMTKALSLLLCLLMLVNMLPVSVLASEATPDEPSAQTEQQPAECQHTGGSATCKALAVCDNCKQSYGEYAAHSGGTATCTALAVCETCGEGYGALAEHSYSAGVCTVCNGADPDYVPPCEHTGGTATCTAQAVCTVCAAAYGELADHSYDNGVCSCGEVCAHAEYAEGKCTLCGAAQPEVACTCETDDPAYHAPFCALYERTGDACTCEVKCTEENHNIYCEVCYFDGIAACTGGEEDQIPYTSGPCGDSVTYTLAADGTLTISGTGAMQDWTFSDHAPWFDDKDSIQSVVIEGGVTSIGNRAFSFCESLTSVTIAGSVTSIGNHAFSGCSSLTSVDIPGSVTSIDEGAFRECSVLTIVDIPDSVTSIGDSVFYNCIGLTSMTIGNSVTSIGNSAFSSCWALTSVVIPDSVTSIGDSAFHGCSALTSVTIPGSVTSIGDSAFYDCSGLTSVTIPDSVTEMGSGAFNRCSNLTSVTIGNSVTSIGDGTFESCSSLTSVEIPDSVTEMGRNAFRGCNNLTSVTIGNSVTSIGGFAFFDCTSLTSVTAPCNSTVDGRSLYAGEETLLYTFDDSVTIDIAKHEAIGTGNCVCGYNPIASVTVRGDPTSWGYAPDATATLTATATLEEGYTATTTSYAWVKGNETVADGNSNPLILTGLNADEHSYTCTVTVDGYTKTSDAIKVSVSKADSTVTAAPTGRSLTYSGEGQYLINEGNASGGTVQYSLDGKSYSEAIPQGTDVGKYTVYYKVVGDADHKDTTADSVTATIAPKSIADCSVSLPQSDFTYSGTEPILNVTAVDNGNTLMKGTDYELGSVEKNAGNYTLTVTGIGNYTGTVELHYTIHRSTSRIQFNGFNPLWTYTGEEFPNPMASHLTITGAGYEDVRFTWYKDGEPIFGNPIDAGTYKVVAEIPESENTRRSEAQAENIIVKPLTAEVPTITLDDKIHDYDGTAKTPAVTVKYEGKIIPASEYTVSYSDNINAGTATVTITDKDGGNYIVSGSTQFTIKPRLITVSGITARDKVYDGSTRANLGDGVPSYSNIPEGEDPRFVIQVALSYDSAAAGEDKPISIKFVDVGVADGYNAKNYVLVADKIYADIRPKDISDAESCEFNLTETSFVYSSEAPELTVTGVDYSLGTLIEDTDYTVGAAQINAGSHKLTVTGKGNYTGTVEFSYTITKADSSVTQVPVAVSDLTFNGGNQNLITAGTVNGGTMQYRLSQNESFSSAISTGKNAGTYTVYYKVVGDANHNDSAEGSVTVTIAKAAATAAKIPVQKHFHDYATANTLALSQYLPADRGETTYTLGAITGNFFADGTAVTETGSLTYTTRGMDAVATGSIAVNVVMENYGDVTLTVPVELVAVNAQTEERIVKNGLTEVPAGLANTGFNTVEKIKAEQQRVLGLLLGRDPQGNIAHYDVKLQFTPDGGKTWVDATEENFPADGLTVTLPYPSGTGKDSYKFVVSHMFTTGNKAGTTETPAVTKTADGIQFAVTGLSPVSVAWSAIPFDVNIATVTNGTVYVSHAHTTAGTQVTITVTPKSGYKLSTLMVKDAAGNSYAISTDNNGKYYFTMPAANVTVTATFSRISTATADPTNPKTGDDFHILYWSGMMLASLSGLAALVLGKKKFYRR